MIRELVSIDEALAYLGRYFDHHDFSQYPLDEPFPELGDVGTNSFRSTTDRIKADAREWMVAARGRPSHRHAELALPRHGRGGRDGNRPLGRRGAADGFILGFQVVAEGLRDFLDQVLPVLEARGRHTSGIRQGTLRDHLRLPRRESRYADNTAGHSAPLRRAR